MIGKRAALVANRFPYARHLLVALLASGPHCPTFCAETTAANEVAATAMATADKVPAQTASVGDVDRRHQPWMLPKEHHVWARFPVGSWREIEISTETFEENGKLFGQSVTTQKEILKAVADDSYVLDVQATVDVSGKRIAGPWNTRVLRLLTERSGTVFSTTRQADELLELTIGTVSCQVWDVQSTEESRNLVDRLYYTPDVFTHILRRDILERTNDSPAEPPVLDATAVSARSVPFTWEGKIIDCVRQDTVRRREKGQSQTIALLSPNVPGGEVQSQSTDFDSAGRRIRWSIQRLVNYEAGPSDGIADGPVVSHFSGGQEQE